MWIHLASTLDGWDLHKLGILNAWRPHAVINAKDQEKKEKKYFL